uniref:deoxyribonuclease gamma-like n=1 Tax=Myxine glutinosa TaxID=7769 RepID=UPI00358FAE90
MDKSLFLFFFILACCFDINHALKVCSFSGLNRKRNTTSCPDAVTTLLDMVSRCDISVFSPRFYPEDKKIDKLQMFVDNLNSKYSGKTFAHVESDIFTVKSQKFWHVIIYRSDLGEVKYIASTRSQQMKDYEIFDTRRFFIRFQAQNTGISDCILVPVLTTTNVKKEVDELFDMFDAVEEHWPNKNVMFLGDFSTIAKYLDTQEPRINNYGKFQWLIDGEMDTMVKPDINYANDRFVAFGTQVQNAVVPGSAKPFNFLINYSLSQEEGLCIMDHYPIELDLEPPPHGIQ